MFFVLLIVTLVVSLGTSILTARFFDGAVHRILIRLVGDEDTSAWRKYLLFAIVVVGVSGGVRLWELEKYITGKGDSAPLELNAMRWVLEIYRSVIETLQSIAWMLLLFFLCALVAFVIMRAIERRADTE
ncbi:hypothetical protein [Paludibacterium yongneupense]|uniref:hypothetical protein n=1 Tax=Paludibacterium yongneupense TaxID=400061 RepID=UPI00042993DC|nr:hypothetical protein [Paludibacterium yongneupense]